MEQARPRGRRGRGRSIRTGVSPFIVVRDAKRGKRSDTMKSRGGGEKNDRGGNDGMGFFARLLTTISIVYDFNNLGAASASRASTRFRS